MMYDRLESSDQPLRLSNQSKHQFRSHKYFLNQSSAKDENLPFIAPCRIFFLAPESFRNRLMPSGECGGCGPPGAAFLFPPDLLEILNRAPQIIILGAVQRRQVGFPPVPRLFTTARHIFPSSSMKPMIARELTAERNTRPSSRIRCTRK